MPYNFNLAQTVGVVLDQGQVEQIQILPDLLQVNVYFKELRSRNLVRSGYEPFTGASYVAILSELVLPDETVGQAVKRIVYKYMAARRGWPGGNVT